MGFKVVERKTVDDSSVNEKGKRERAIEIRKKGWSFVIGSLFAAFIVLAAFVGLLWFSGSDFAVNDWSGASDALSTIIGIPTAVIGTFLAIMLAYQAVWSSDEAAKLTEEQNDLAERQARLEHDQKIAEFSNATLEHYADLAMALYELERNSLDLYAQIGEMRLGKCKESSVLVERDQVCGSLTTLAKATAALIGDPFAKAAWVDKSLSSGQMKVLNYYDELNKNSVWNSSGLRPDQRDEFDRARELTTEHVDRFKGSLEPNDNWDQVCPQMARSRVGSLDRRDIVWGVDFSPLGLARHFSDLAEKLLRTTVVELTARHRFAEYACRIGEITSFKQAAYNYEDRGGFRTRVPESSGEADSGRNDWAERKQDRAAMYFGSHEPVLCNQMFNHELLMALGLIDGDLPRCHVWYGSEPEKVTKRPKRTSKINREKAQNLASKYEKESEEAFKKQLKKYEYDKKGAQSDPVFVNRGALAIVGLLEKIPMENEIESISHKVIEESWTNDGIDRLTEILKNGDIAGRFSPKQHEVMEVFWNNASALLWPSAPELSDKDKADTTTASSKTSTVLTIEGNALKPA